jgi:hypothetical protein
MKEEIKKDIMQWYQDNNKHDFKLEDLTDKIIDKTTDILFPLSCYPSLYCHVDFFKEPVLGVSLFLI